MNRKRGYLLVELMVTLAIFALVMTIALRVLADTLRTGRELSESQQQTLAIDHATRQLRRDVEGSTDPQANAAGVNLGSIRWYAESKALIRTVGDRAERFEPLPAAASFESANGTVTLHVGDATWTLAPLLAKGTP